MASNLENLAQLVAKETGFVLGSKIYEGEYYQPGNVRNLIFDGSYEGKPAVLKLYDDPRITDEPIALEAFHRTNTSRVIRAPQLYRYEMLSPHKGWMIIEKLPDGGAFFTTPLSAQERETFAVLYREYRENFPTEPTRPLTLAEQLPAGEYHSYRVGRWFELAASKEVERQLRGDKPLIDPRRFVPQYLKALELIRKEFSGLKMIWCHAHFKPHELYRVPGQEYYYLIDFAHVSMKPEGYELAFLVWSDYIMHADWRLPYAEWKQGVIGWLEAFRSLPETLRGQRFDTLMRASLLERCLGTILADITAAERPQDEAEERIALLGQLVHDLLEEKP